MATTTNNAAKTKTNRHGEKTSLTHAAALTSARRNAKYRHGEWFAWQHTSGEWYVSSTSHVASLEDAELNVIPGSKIYAIGGGGRHSMVFFRWSAAIIKNWISNAKISA